MRVLMWPAPFIRPYLKVLSFLRDALGGTSDPDPLLEAKSPVAGTSGAGGGGGGGGDRPSLRRTSGGAGTERGTERVSGFSMSTLSRGVRSSSEVSRPSGVSGRVFHFSARPEPLLPLTG